MDADLTLEKAKHIVRQYEVVQKLQSWEQTHHGMPHLSQWSDADLQARHTGAKVIAFTGQVPTKPPPLPPICQTSSHSRSWDRSPHLLIKVKICTHKCLCGQRPDAESVRATKNLMIPMNSQPSFLPYSPKIWWHSSPAVWSQALSKLEANIGFDKFPLRGHITWQQTLPYLVALFR